MIGNQPLKLVYDGLKIKRRSRDLSKQEEVQRHWQLVMVEMMSACFKKHILESVLVASRECRCMHLLCASHFIIVNKIQFYPLISVTADKWIV